MAEETEKKKSGRGGRREGSGRPRSMENKKIYTFRAGDRIGRILDTMPRQSEFIRSCIERCIDNTPDFSQLGDATPATAIRPLSIREFDISIPAGFPLDINSDRHGQQKDLLSMVCPHPEASYVIHVQGNSMIDANIHSGDIVVIDSTRRDPLPSQVAVCELNGEYTLKRFQKRDGIGYLVPANPAFPEIPVTPDDTFNIWGTVTYVIHKPE